MQIKSMTLVLSTLQIRRHEYSEDLNIVKFVGLCILLLYAINMDAVKLFANPSFLFLPTLNLYCINALYQFEWEWMSFIFVKKKRQILSYIYSVKLITFFEFLKHLIFWTKVKIHKLLKLNALKQWFSNDGSVLLEFDISELDIIEHCSN